MKATEDGISAFLNDKRKMSTAALIQCVHNMLCLEMVNADYQVVKEMVDELYRRHVINNAVVRTRDLKNEN